MGKKLTIRRTKNTSKVQTKTWEIFLTTKTDVGLNTKIEKEVTKQRFNARRQQQTEAETQKAK